MSILSLIRNRIVGLVKGTRRVAINGMITLVVAFAAIVGSEASAQASSPPKVSWSVGIKAEGSTKFKRVSRHRKKPKADAKAESLRKANPTAEVRVRKVRH